jgi:hypothetical protein
VTEQASRSFAEQKVWDAINADEAHTFELGKAPQPLGTIVPAAADTGLRIKRAAHVTQSGRGCQSARVPRELF